MESPETSRGIDACGMQLSEKAPVLARYAKTKGWYYAISWLHRLTGIGLFIALAVHLYLRTSSLAPAASTASTAGTPIPAWPICGLLVWISSLGMGSHALNGGRLILYELFGKRNDAAMTRWTFGLTIAYSLLFIPGAVMENPDIPASLYWWVACMGGAAAAVAVVSRIGRSRHSLLWKLQRISGAFLFVTAPAYLLLSHLNQASDGLTRFAVPRMPDASVRGIVFAIAISALYHGGYGLFSIVADYVSSRAARRALIALIVAVSAALMYWAFRLTLLAG